MHTLDSLARTLAASRSAPPPHRGRPVLAPLIALICATLPLLTMIRVYTSSV